MFNIGECLQESANFHTMFKGHWFVLSLGLGSGCNNKSLGVAMRKMDCHCLCGEMTFVSKEN